MFPIRDSIVHTKFPTVMWVIIAINVAAFLYQLSLGADQTGAFLREYALVPRRYFDPSWARSVGLSPLDITPFVTNVFLHGGFLHIIFNLWTLYIFGPSLEEGLGPARFTAIYLVSGLAAGVAHAVFNASSAAPALGASGAIAGVLAAYALKFPFAWVRVLVLVVFFPLFFDIPALVFAGLWFGLQVLQGTTSLLLPSAGAGIAWWAHIGGFLAGYFLVGRLDRDAGRTMTSIHTPARFWFPFWRA